MIVILFLLAGIAFAADPLVCSLHGQSHVLMTDGTTRHTLTGAGLADIFSTTGLDVQCDINQTSSAQSMISSRRFLISSTTSPCSVDIVHGDQPGHVAVWGQVLPVTSLEEFVSANVDPALGLACHAIDDDTITIEITQRDAERFILIESSLNSLTITTTNVTSCSGACGTCQGPQIAPRAETFAVMPFRAIQPQRRCGSMATLPVVSQLPAMSPYSDITGTTSSLVAFASPEDRDAIIAECSGRDHARLIADSLFAGYVEACADDIASGASPAVAKANMDSFVSVIENRQKVELAADALRRNPGTVICAACMSVEWDHPINTSTVLDVSKILNTPGGSHRAKNRSMYKKPAAHNLYEKKTSAPSQEIGWPSDQKPVPSAPAATSMPSTSPVTFSPLMEVAPTHKPLYEHHFKPAIDVSDGIFPTSQPVTSMTPSPRAQTPFEMATPLPTGFEKLPATIRPMTSSPQNSSDLWTPAPTDFEALPATKQPTASNPKRSISTPTTSPGNSTLPSMSQSRSNPTPSPIPTPSPSGNETSPQSTTTMPTTSPFSAQAFTTIPTSLPSAAQAFTTMPTTSPSSTQYTTTMPTSSPVGNSSSPQTTTSSPTSSPTASTAATTIPSTVPPTSSPVGNSSSPQTTTSSPTSSPTASTAATTIPSTVPIPVQTTASTAATTIPSTVPTPIPTTGNSSLPQSTTTVPTSGPIGTVTPNNSVHATAPVASTTSPGVFTSVPSTTLGNQSAAIYQLTSSPPQPATTSPSYTTDPRVTLTSSPSSISATSVPSSLPTTSPVTNNNSVSAALTPSTSPIPTNNSISAASTPSTSPIATSMSTTSPITTSMPTSSPVFTPVPSPALTTSPIANMSAASIPSTSPAVPTTLPGSGNNVSASSVPTTLPIAATTAPIVNASAALFSTSPTSVPTLTPVTNQSTASVATTSPVANQFAAWVPSFSPVVNYSNAATPVPTTNGSSALGASHVPDRSSTNSTRPPVTSVPIDIPFILSTQAVNVTVRPTRPVTATIPPTAVPLITATVAPTALPLTGRGSVYGCHCNMSAMALKDSLDKVQYALDSYLIDALTKSVLDGYDHDLLTVIACGLGGPNNANIKSLSISVDQATDMCRQCEYSVNKRSVGSTTPSVGRRTRNIVPTPAMSNRNVGLTPAMNNGNAPPTPIGNNIPSSGYPPIPAMNGKGYPSIPAMNGNGYPSIPAMDGNGYPSIPIVNSNPSSPSVNGYPSTSTMNNIPPKSGVNGFYPNRDVVGANNPVSVISRTHSQAYPVLA